MGADGATNPAASVAATVDGERARTRPPGSAAAVDLAKDWECLNRKALAFLGDRDARAFRGV